MKGFVNPYNFIKFPPKKARAYTDEDRHTGYIEYTITTKTPLFIPNSSSDTAFRKSDQVADHKSYDFFSYTELDKTKRYEGEYHVPVIPGSEMRGVVRNVYETLTDSCMGMLNSDEYPVKRSSEAFKPAVMHKDQDGKYVLYEAKSLRVGDAASRGKKPQGFEKYPNGTVIYYREPPRNNKGQPEPIKEFSVKSGVYPKKGYLIKWGMGVKKSRYHVFAVKKNLDVEAVIRGIQLSKDIIERKLLRVIDYYLSESGLAEDNKKAYEEYRKDVETFLQKKEEAYFPVTYSTLEKGIYYLAPAVFTKEVSDNSLGKLAGEFGPCEKDYCPACDLFGYVGKNNESCKGSGIRFTDLYVTDEKDPKAYYSCDRLTIQALGEPKLGNIEFYLKKPENATFWNYDYYIKHGKTIIQDGELRGRKYYWHHRNVKLPQDIEATRLNKTIRPVREAVSFQGRLYYEDISKRQLEQLVWILNSGSEGLGLKLGGAKPLGLGSVACKVDQVIERSLSVQDGKLEYRMDKITAAPVSYEHAGFSKAVKGEFYKIAGLKSVPGNVEITYPKDIMQKNKILTEGYRWFVNNHTTVSGGGMARGRADVKINSVLPEILEQDFSLTYNERPQRNNFSYNRNGGRRNDDSGGYRGNRSGNNNRNNNRK